MSKGDYISVTVRTGGAGLTQRTVTAEKSGRTVEYEMSKDAGLQWIVVTERTRGGTIVREERFTASEVLILSSQVKAEE